MKNFSFKRKNKRANSKSSKSGKVNLQNRLGTKKEE